MRCYMNFSGILIGAKESEYKMDNGQKGLTYALALEQNDDVGNVPCEKEVFEAVKSGQFPKYGELNFVAYYDTNYKRTKVCDISHKKK